MTQFKPDLLSRFAASANAVQKQSPIDYRLLPILVLAILVLTTETIYIAISDLTFPVGLLMRIFWLLILTFCGGLLARNYGLTRIGNFLQAVALPSIVGALAVVATVILTRFSTSFSDTTLARADKVLGFNWIALLKIFYNHPTFLEISRNAYNSFYFQFAVIGPALFALNKSAAGSRFLVSWTIALWLCVVIYPLFTAEGPYLFYGILRTDVPHLHGDALWETGAAIQAIRDHRSTDVVGSMAGLISCPSFHAAGAVLFTRALWPFGWLRWLVLPLNLLVIASTPVFGSHYIVDLIGGIAVAVVAIILAEKLTAHIESRVGGYG